MCKALEDMKKESEEIGRKQGRKQGSKQGRRQGSNEKTEIVVRNMLKRNMKEDDICQLAECSPKFVDFVRQRMKKKIMD